MTASNPIVRGSSKKLTDSEEGGQISMGRRYHEVVRFHLPCSSHHAIMGRSKGYGCTYQMWRNQTNETPKKESTTRARKEKRKQLY